MKPYHSFLFIAMMLFSTCQCRSQSLEEKERSLDTDEVELNWILSENDTLTYRTVMSEIEDAKFKFDVDGLLGFSVDSTSANFDDFFEAVKSLEIETNLFTRLTESQDFEEVIDVEMIAVPKNTAEPDDGDEEEEGIMKKMARSMFKGTMLRGSVKKTGGLNSFWVQSRQKNLISLFFELPEKSLEIGAVWTLDNVNFIGNDHNFICRKAEKRNEVTLVDLKRSKEETIAVINYDIFEYVSGDFTSPVFLGNGAGKKETTMKFVYKAQAEFSVEKGKWISYNGVMALDASGVMESSQRQKFSLIE